VAGRPPWELRGHGRAARGHRRAARAPPGQPPGGNRGCGQENFRSLCVLRWGRARDRPAAVRNERVRLCLASVPHAHTLGLKAPIGCFRNVWRLPRPRAAPGAGLRHAAHGLAVSRKFPIHPSGSRCARAEATTSRPSHRSAHYDSGLRWPVRFPRRLPSDVQDESIPLMLGGGDVMVAAETGSGKTGAFGLPAVQLAYEIRQRQLRGDTGPASAAAAAPAPVGKPALSAEDRSPWVSVAPSGLVAQSRNPHAWGGVRGSVGESFRPYGPCLLLPASGRNARRVRHAATVMPRTAALAWSAAPRRANRP